MGENAMRKVILAAVVAPFLLAACGHDERPVVVTSPQPQPAAAVVNPAPVVVSPQPGTTVVVPGGTRVCPAGTIC
jgi:uncharacterized lipoprotein YajG